MEKKMSKENEAKLKRIKAERKVLGIYLRTKSIKNSEISTLFKINSSYGVIEINTNLSRKKLMLVQILNAPFLLCDQEYLSIPMKKELPNFLINRYKAELEELKYFHEQGLISNEEYIADKEDLKFIYFKSSEEGKAILKEI